MDLKMFNSAIAQIAEEKAIPPEKVLEVAQAAISAAYKKEYGQKGQIIKADFDPKSGLMEFWQVKIVVDKDLIYSEEELAELQEKRAAAGETHEMPLIEEEGAKKVVFNPEKHMMLAEAKKLLKDVKIGDEVKIPLPSKIDFGRIAAQTAKHAIVQKIRQAEKEIVLKEFKDRLGDVVSGTIVRLERGDVIVDLGRVEAIMPVREKVATEEYQAGDRIRAYVTRQRLSNYLVAQPSGFCAAAVRIGNFGNQRRDGENRGYRPRSRVPFENRGLQPG